MVVFNLRMRLSYLPSLCHFYFLCYNRMNANPVAVQTVEIQPGTALLVTCAGCGGESPVVAVSPLAVNPENNSPAYAPASPAYAPVYNPESPAYAPASPQYGMELSPVFSPVYASPNSVNASQMNFGESGRMASFGRTPNSKRSKTRSSKGSKRSRKSKTSKKPRRNERR